jgi:ubiquinone/menaquinone biosynthesis C-methylase UbiE
LNTQLPSRAEREIEHGRKLASSNPESIWGWSSPAGKERAAHRARRIIAGAQLRPHMHVMELGCGTGNFTEMFAASGARITAVDISPELLALARSRRLPPAQITFLEARFEDLELGDQFDAVIGSSVLHHLDIADALKNIHRLLRPGGVLSFAEPNMLNPVVFAIYHSETLRERVGNSPDERAFYRWQLSNLLQSAGFVEIRVRPFDFLHPATPPALIPLIQRTGMLLERLPLLREIAGSLHIRARKAPH